MKTKKTLLALLASVGLVFALSSCEKEQIIDRGNADLRFAAVNSTGTTLRSTPVGGVVVGQFKINIDEIEFEIYDNPNDDYPDGESYSELELEGPFEVDLVKDGNTQLSTLVAGLTLPETGFDEINFEFEQSENRNSILYGKTILVTGTINGVAFEYISRIDEFEVEVEFDEPVSLDLAREASITVSINLAAIFNPAMGGVDITTARDGNGNGRIEISLNDNDGNRALAGKIEAAILRAIDVEEEERDDDDDDDE